MQKFNLLEEKWIRCIHLSGKDKELGIRDLIIHAHSLKCLSNPVPLVNASVLLLLETILVRALSLAGIALESYDDWFKGYKAGVFDAKIMDDYLGTWHDRFYLFDEKYPFWQAKIEGDKYTGSAMKLLPHYSGGTGGNSATLFDHHTEKKGISLSIKDAANYLLAAHQFGAGGRIIGGDYFSESLSSNGLSFFLEGENLFETLYLNLLPYPDLASVGLPTKPSDRPIWESDDPYGDCGRNAIEEEKKVLYQPLGLLDLLTWPDRKIQLILGEDDFIHEIKMRAGIRMENKYFPCYAYNPRGFALRAQLDHVVWRDFASLLQFSGSITKEDQSRSPYAVQWLHELTCADYHFDHPFRLMALGMAKEAGKQKVSFYSEQQLPLPQKYLIEKDIVITLAGQISLAELIQKSLYGAVMNFAENFLSLDADKKNGRKPDPADKRSLLEHLGTIRIYWEKLGDAFPALVVNLPIHEEEAILQWKKDIRNAAKKAFNEAVSLAGESVHVLKSATIARSVLEAGMKKKLGNN